MQIQSQAANVIEKHEMNNESVEMDDDDMTSDISRPSQLEGGDEDNMQANGNMRYSQTKEVFEELDKEDIMAFGSRQQQLLTADVSNFDRRESKQEEIIID